MDARAKAAYVYGVVSAEAAPVRAAGISGKPVEAVPFRRVAALVSDVHVPIRAKRRSSPRFHPAITPRWCVAPMAARASGWSRFTTWTREAGLHMKIFDLNSSQLLLVPEKMKKTARVLLLPLLFSLGLVASATTVIPPTFDELVSRAQVIFEGEVTGLQSQWIGEGAERRIVTYVTFKVDDALKGDPGATYSMRMLGGTVDGRTMAVTDAPKFKVGDHDLLFVENNGSQFIPLVGIQHGRFRIQQDQTGRASLLTGAGQPLADVNQLGGDESTLAHSKTSLSLNDFKAAIRSRIAQQEAKAKTQ